jgi:hypothetical protein
MCLLLSYTWVNIQIHIQNVPSRNDPSQNGPSHNAPSLKVPSTNSPQHETTQHITSHHQMTQVTKLPITKRPRTSHYSNIYLKINWNKYKILKLCSKSCSINRYTVHCTVYSIGEQDNKVNILLKTRKLFWKNWQVLEKIREMGLENLLCFYWYHCKAKIILSLFYLKHF